MTLERGVGLLELWSAPPNDFGALAWVDTRTAEVVFAGPITWAGGGDSTRPPEDPSVRIAAAPVPMADIVTVDNPHWSDAATLAAVGRFGVRTEAFARYAACDTTTVVAHVYTPAVGATNEAAARGLLIVVGRRATAEL